MHWVQGGPDAMRYEQFNCSMRVARVEWKLQGILRSNELDQ
jgi:hypothetical protein